MSSNQGNEDEGLAPSRRLVDVKTNSLVRRGSEIYRVSQVLDFESVVGDSVVTGRSTVLRVGELQAVEDGASGDYLATDIDEIVDSDWKIAEQRLEAIRPLLEAAMVGRQDVKARAEQIGVDTATLYRWLQRYRATDSVSSLIPRQRGWKAGRGRLSPLVEAVIQEVITSYYLTAQRPADQKVITEVQRLCLKRHLEAPSDSAIRARIARVSERDRLRGRGFKERAKNKFLPAPGSFPNADYPLSVIQIDHTPADIILVDDVYRKPIGRPWITLAIDVCTRMVTGYFLSFDAPSEASVAMCVAHSLLPKEEWLLLHNVESEWPVWGRPTKIHVDNGPDFRSNSFRQSCLMHGINLEFRPVKQPRYGGHIERMLGTLLREIHDLPGTTFSSVKHREGYDSERHATMTKSEFEEWLVTLICKVYHKRLHSGIGMPPLKRWEIGIFGNAQVAGTGVPPRPADRLTVLLDFLPSFRRTVQPIGVTIDKLTYYADALRPWIGATDPDDSKAKREFIFRRDPRDISTIWFFDPEAKLYFKVPLADQSLPSMSIWEYNLAREALAKAGINDVDERQILRAITELREKVDAAKEKTKKARRMAQRRADHERGVSPVAPLESVRTAPASPLSMKSQPPAGKAAQAGVKLFEGAVDGLLQDDVAFDGDIA